MNILQDNSLNRVIFATTQVLLQKESNELKTDTIPEPKLVR